MKNLYYISLYSSHHNQYIRYMLTAISEDAARSSVMYDSVNPYYRISTVQFICTTPDDIYTEI